MSSGLLQDPSPSW